jgi:hypothetical protein
MCQGYRQVHIYITWTDILVIQFPDDDKRDAIETLVYLLFKHLMKLLAQGSLIEFTHHEISRMYIMVHVLHSVISDKSSVTVCSLHTFYFFHSLMTQVTLGMKLQPAQGKICTDMMMT